MPITNVGARWNEGVLEFFDKATGDDLFAFDGTNKTLTIADGVVFVPNLPETDPEVAGALYIDSEGAIAVSEGPGEA
jgi:hypothetical protein